MSSDASQSVAVIGVGHTKFSGGSTQGLRELASEAGFNAMRDADTDPSDVDCLVVGVASGAMSEQYSPAAMVADSVGLRGVMLQRCEAACATGSAALAAAVRTVKAGEARTALVIGAEVMSKRGTAESTYHLSRMTDCEFEYPLGITFPGMFGLMASSYMNRYSSTQEDLALVSVKNHENALENPYAQFHRRISVDDVLNSKMVADPLHLLDCSPVSDGAAAVVISCREVAEKKEKAPVWIRGIGSASLGNLLAERRDLTSIPSVRLAARRAFANSGLRPDDVDVAELHDCFTIAELIEYEELGFAERGKGAHLLRNGDTSISGRIPVNPSGGLKAKGHPLGATGLSMVVEIVKQLRGELPAKRRVNGAKVGLTQNMGLTGQYSFVYVLSR
ncbi:MAG: thiolase domain-containing protein [Thermoprotei archaeon]